MSDEIVLGQFWTPPEIAEEMVRLIFTLEPKTKYILDPSCGPGTFSEAFTRVGTSNIELDCIDIDKRYSELTKQINRKSGLLGNTISEDYLIDNSLENKYDAIIMNPPYIRQEQILPIKKNLYYRKMDDLYNQKINRRSNILILFLLKGIIDLKPGGILCAIVYDAIAQTQYGKNALAILEKRSNLIYSQHIKTPFRNVLIDARIMVFRKKIIISSAPELINSKFKGKNGYVNLGSLLNTRRGICFSKRQPFLACPNDPHYDYSVPILLKQNNLEMIAKASHRFYLAVPSVKWSDEFKNWLINRVKLNNQKQLRIEYQPISGEIVFNYYIRNHPRHLWNPERIPASDNYYISSVNHGFPGIVAWLLLNSDLYIQCLVNSGRSQGNGLVKLQLFEYKDAFVPNWEELSEDQKMEISSISSGLLDSDADFHTVNKSANEVVDWIGM